ncbi:Tuberous sclerosis 2-like protein [Cytospora paraplurivora]|uniref:Tuberous sclerosis 2-like protein n=1 Tax=Cytospora paraplurivora TaxID=2898453 RepID=A0AAN9U7A4_9PEZI
MTPPPLPPGDDVAPSPEPKSAGGLASVFKGLTSAAKLVKPPPLPSSSTDTVSAQLSSERVDTASLAASGLPSHHSEALDKLKNGSLSERTAAAESLRLFIADYPLAPILQIWDAGKDLIEASKPYNARAAGWELLTECAKNPSSTDLERKEYFQTLSAPANPDDFHLQLAALMELTSHGRSLSGFDYEVIPLLTTWLHDSYGAVKSARKQTMLDKKSSKGKGVAVPFVALGEEKNFSRLFAFILEVLKFNFRVADDDTLGRLIDTLLDISTNTSVEEDLMACIDVIDAIITYASIPKRNLSRCVEVLSSVFCIVERLGKVAWHTLSHLLKSHNGQATVRILLSILREYPHKDQDTKEAARSVRGSLTVLQKLIWKSTERGYPTVPLSLLVDGCNNIVEQTPSTRVVGCVMKLFNILFNDGAQHISPLLEDEDWTFLLEVAEKCVGRLPSHGTPTRYTSALSKDSLPQGDAILSELEIFLLRLEGLFQQRRSEFIQRQECIAFLARIPHVLQDSTAGIVLDHFKEFRCCYPSDLEWEKNLELVMNCFYLDRDRSTFLRSAALRAITEVYDMLELVEDELDEDIVPNIVRSILSEIAHETDTLVLQLTVSFMISVAVAADPALFDYIVDTLKGVITSERLQSPIAEKDDFLAIPDQHGSLATQSPADVVTRGYVQLFMKTMNTDGRKAAKTFDLLVYTAKLGRSTDATLTAMKLLFRVRADWANRIYLTSFTESEGLAGVLHRTEASLARKLAEDAVMPHRSRSDYGNASRLSRGVSFTSTAQERLGPSRSASSAKPHNYHQLWSLPDADALPETPSPNASSVLFSCTEKRSDLGENGDDQTTEQPSGVLNIGSWLDAVLHNLTQGSDWEVYSFNLVHLSSQLSNHALFRDAVFQIREARRLLCEQSKHSLFQDPPPATGLRRPEVNICIFQILTTIMSYHQHFQKSDEDDLVRTFMQGIGHSTAKTCIHALTICCHELPLATTKALVTILQKMSTVITQANVAMHILEFLAGLARMPVLYSNFIEEEFRIVFGMCFRYLDTVRDKKRYGRVSTGENVVATINATHEYNMLGQPTTSDDLPQYVHALAYHVIIFWFLALRLSDRAKHVGWIAKRLFQGPDGSLVSDEQAIITIDYMQRVAFADADESEENPRFSPRKASEYIERRWLIANCIVSIKQSKNTPWAQVTKRQPSGTSYFTVRENFKPPPPHQAGTFGESRDRGSLTTNSALPSHLLVHLLSSIPQCYDPALRPLLLPDEEAVDRSIRTFDRISTVDGHKVGVVYIGENQTHETEILANVSGSADYITLLNGMGTLTKLKGADFNTQGLDREYDTDGQYTFCWRDRVTEIVFHVTTQMPTNLDHDPQCISKKRHIGNDFVTIVFNDSGLPFKFDTFPSEFNYVYIVITPESRASFVATREHTGENPVKDAAEDGYGKGGYVPFFKVQIMSKEGFPEISPCAATKMVSLRALPDFVRLLALNASVFSVVWSNREQGEPPSAWRSRLREINRLRERHGPKTTTPGTASSSSSTIIAPGPPPPLSLGTALASVQQQSQQGGGGSASIDSRPSSGAARDSISALSLRDLRRTSVATFLTTTTDQNSQSHRSSIVSNSTAETEMMIQAASLDYLVESLDFSKWA